MTSPDRAKEAVQNKSKASPRKQLCSFSTIEDVISAINSCNNILVISGAGISVSCGIPDFRSKNGIYNTLCCQDIGIPAAELLFDLSYFLMEPEPFYKYAHNLMPQDVTPSLSHHFVAMLESRKKLLRNYTQNIDGLERVAGVTRLAECHGSMGLFKCVKCKRKIKREEVVSDVVAGRVPRCSVCSGLMKPAITFFGEALDPSISRYLKDDIKRCDLVLVMGTSLKVGGAVLSLLGDIKSDVPQILLNLEAVSPPKGLSDGFDVSLLGKCDEVIAWLCTALGWDINSSSFAPAKINKNRKRKVTEATVSHEGTIRESTKELPCCRRKGERVYCFTTPGEDLHPDLEGCPVVSPYVTDTEYNDSSEQNRNKRIDLPLPSADMSMETKVTYDPQSDDDKTSICFAKRSTGRNLRQLRCTSKSDDFVYF